MDTEAIQIVDEMAVGLDLENLGPTGMNLPHVRRAFDILAEASRQAYPIAEKTGEYLIANGWVV